MHSQEEACSKIVSNLIKRCERIIFKLENTQRLKLD